MSRLAALALLASLSLGCSWAKASPYDHAAYRQTVVAPTLEARLKAADAYLTTYPNGAYADEVRSYMTTTEPLFYKSRQTSVIGLEAYLDTLPNGPNAAQIRSRLRAIRELAARPDSMLVAARMTEDRLRRAQAGREIARQEVAFWLGLLADPTVYEDALSRGPAELVQAFSLALPAPRCVLDAAGVERTCTKELTFEFEVPSAEGPEDRVLVFDVVLVQDAEGRPLHARIEGEELFLRVEETFAKRALSAAIAEEQAASFARALEFADGALLGLGPSEGPCPRADAPPGLPPKSARFTCERLSVVVVRGEGAAPDRIEISPLAAGGATPPPATP